MSSSPTSVPSPLRLAMLGMIEGNGHPYSWSAIINGYEPVGLAGCPYEGIRDYMSREPRESVGIPGARVTHVWTDDPADAPKVAAMSMIDHVVERPEDVIGHVDAVIIATDDGNDHVRRARPFMEAGLPVFIDKPLATTIPELRQFLQWHREGRVFLSTSGMRYALEGAEAHARLVEVGTLRWIVSFMVKTWERYGIHALEAVWSFFGSGFLTVRATTDASGDVIHATHRNGVRLTTGTSYDAVGAAGIVSLMGTKGDITMKFAGKGNYAPFRGQLVAFIEMLRSGVPPFPVDETVELMAVIIAGIRSREQGGREISVSDILNEIHA